MSIHLSTLIQKPLSINGCTRLTESVFYPMNSVLRNLENRLRVKKMGRRRRRRREGEKKKREKKKKWYE